MPSFYIANILTILGMFSVDLLLFSMEATKTNFQNYFKRRAMEGRRMTESNLHELMIRFESTLKKYEEWIMVSLGIISTIHENKFIFLKYIISFQPPSASPLESSSGLGFLLFISSVAWDLKFLPFYLQLFVPYPQFLFSLQPDQTSPAKFSWKPLFGFYWTEHSIWTVIVFSLPLTPSFNFWISPHSPPLFTPVLSAINWGHRYQS